MGYDMYRLGPDGKRLPADWPTFEDDGKGTYPDELIGEYDDRNELSDSNYFRLNMWGMSKVNDCTCRSRCYHRPRGCSSDC